MYGLIGKFRSVAGKRDELIAIMKSGSVKMPGCLSYVTAKDPSDPDALWITEVWTDKESHKASLAIPEVAETIKKAMPLIGGFDQHIETEPVDIA
jgi:quinol monooxygenase YgiN